MSTNVLHRKVTLRFKAVDTLSSATIRKIGKKKSSKLHEKPWQSLACSVQKWFGKNRKKEVIKTTRKNLANSKNFRFSGFRFPNCFWRSKCLLIYLLLNKKFRPGEVLQQFFRHFTCACFIGGFGVAEFTRKFERFVVSWDMSLKFI